MSQFTPREMIGYIEAHTLGQFNITVCLYQFILNNVSTGNNGISKQTGKQTGDISINLQFQNSLDTLLSAHDLLCFLTIGTRFNIYLVSNFAYTVATAILDVFPTYMDHICNMLSYTGNQLPYSWDSLPFPGESLCQS